MTTPAPRTCTTFRIVTLQQADGTWYGGLHAGRVTLAAFGFPRRDLAWSWAWDQQQSLVRAAHAQEAMQ